MLAILGNTEDPQATVNVSTTPYELPPYVPTTPGCEIVSGPSGTFDGEVGPESTVSLPIDWTPTQAVYSSHTLCSPNQAGAISWTQAPDNDAQTLYQVTVTPKSGGAAPIVNATASDNLITVQMPACTDLAGYDYSITAFKDGVASGLPVNGSFATDPGTPVLISPANGAIVDVAAPITFSWSDPYAPFGYSIYVRGPGAPPPSIFQDSGFTQTSLTETLSLQYGTTYTWSVGAWTAPPSTFTGVIPPQPETTYTFSTPAACNTTVTPGGYPGANATFSLGKTSGTFSLLYQTYEIADDITVYWQYQGKQQSWTTGCVTTPDPCDQNAPPGTTCTFEGLWDEDKRVPSPTFNFSGSSLVTVVVNGGCDTGMTDYMQTGWQYLVNCAQ